MLMFRWSRVAVAVLAVSFVVVGCARMVKQHPEPEPEPEPEPLTLVGTWLWMDSYIDDEDGQEYQERQLLTLTSGGRAIAHNAVLDSAGELLDSWTIESSGWSATDGEITRQWLDDHDDDDQTPRITSSVVKTFYWGEGRATLFVNPWDRGEPGTELHRMVRVTDPLPELTGRWVFEHDHGGLSVVTIGADGAISFDEEFDDGRVFRLTGMIVGVDPDTLIVELADLERTLLAADGSVDRETVTWGRDGTGQFGVVPSVTGGIVVSPPWDESNPEEHPHGNYWMDLARDDS